MPSDVSAAWGLSPMSHANAFGNDGIPKDLQTSNRRTVPLMPAAFESLVKLRDHRKQINRLNKYNFLRRDMAIMCDTSGERMRL